ncbi:radical SAM family heme chaperone HemW [Kamptonema animale CS-326]|jgi:putative oxygen-independent coproporphyrinogen III oxidase|uniref:radical SAM family heme chaperone HemW n=1 Tax=Kamptonema animale TaxID=92934 RepID=UPI0023312F3C|nr:radical SAM family heme chaperone HemW [Kamptonema animale]MDB9512279.1 radical SAM family heme chaperone HemW [Kamptonema animale CS-326]
MSLTVNPARSQFKTEGQFACDLPSSAYLHIPFCRRRCFYCDFPVSVVGDAYGGRNPRKNSEDSGTIQEYVTVLCREIALSAGFCQSLQTVFFGGGTPSLLSVSQLNRILEALDRQFGIAAEAEISMEIDPATFSLEQLQGYKAAGVNRVSLGVQAFQDELLRVCGRSHCVADIYEAVDLVQKAEITNFSLDLISGLPHQSLEQWQLSLAAAVAIAPAHLSCYDLVLEPVTAFGRYFQSGIEPLPADETAAQMYRLAQQILTEAGYEHYEISNYARSGYQCRHNRVYWENRPYYGFGMGAASYLQGVRLTRSRTRKEYYQWVEDSTSVKVAETPMTSHDVLLETVMLGLRLAQGVSLEAIAQKFGENTLEKIWSCLQPYYRQKWVEIAGDNGLLLNIRDGQKLPSCGYLRLSDPEGFLFSNTILATLFSKLEEDGQL